ncbi:MAG: SPOR domain-containing protein [Ramlibacter sp.]
MLRLVVLLLLLANGGYFAWSQGLLRSWGLAPVQQAEPQRLQQQIRPEALRLLSADEARRIETSAPPAVRAAECLQAGLFDEKQVAALRPSLEPLLPPGSWQLEEVVEPARWIIYMGKYPNAEAVNKKKAELRQIGVSFEGLSNAAMEPGLSLGGFTSQAAAQQQLDRLAQRGVRTARVAQERPEVRGQSLKLPLVDEALRPRLEELKPLLNGKPLRSCR